MGIGTAGAARPDMGHRRETPEQETPAQTRSEPASWSEVAAWRRSTRERLLDRRTWMPAKERDARSARIATALDRTIGRIAVLPDILVAPLVGFDDERFRLGYGGGFYDRTIAAAQNGPQVIGVGFDCCRLATIYPQPHDIRMDSIVTDA